MTRPAPRRLCVIGNSHVACLKQAEATSPADLPPTDYFAASANLMSELRPDGTGGLVIGEGLAREKMMAVAGTHRIEVGDYDAFALVGICIHFRDFLRLFRSHCLWRHRQWRGARALVGEPAFEAFLRALYLERPAYRLAQEIRAVRPDARIVLAPAPLPTRGLFQDASMRLLRPLRNTHYVRRVVDLEREVATAAARSVGAAMAFQRPETQERFGYTEARFNERGVGLRSRGKPPSQTEADGADWVAERPDPWHMNAEFGRLRLEDVAAALRAA
jgi:hypothetical protein